MGSGAVLPFSSPRRLRRLSSRGLDAEGVFYDLIAGSVERRAGPGLGKPRVSLWQTVSNHRCEEVCTMAGWLSKV